MDVTLPGVVVYKILAFLDAAQLVALELCETDYAHIYRIKYGYAPYKTAAAASLCIQTLLLLQELLVGCRVPNVARCAAKQTGALKEGHVFYLLDSGRYISYTGLRRFFVSSKIAKCMRDGNMATTPFSDVVKARAPALYDNHRRCCMLSDLMQKKFIVYHIVDCLRGETVFGPAFAFFDYIDKNINKTTVL
jgi:hypothetical protein